MIFTDRWGTWVYVSYFIDREGVGIIRFIFFDWFSMKTGDFSNRWERKKNCQLRNITGNAYLDEWRDHVSGFTDLKHVTQCDFAHFVIHDYRVVAAYKWLEIYSYVYVRLKSDLFSGPLPLCFEWRVKIKHQLCQITPSSLGLVCQTAARPMGFQLQAGMPWILRGLVYCELTDGWVSPLHRVGLLTPLEDVRSCQWLGV